MLKNITIFLFVSTFHVFSQKLISGFDVVGSKLCSDPISGVVKFQNTQNLILEERQISLDSANGITSIVYKFKSSQGSVGIAGDTVRDLRPYLPARNFTPKLKSNFWNFKIYHNIDGVQSLGLNISRNIYDRCFDTKISCVGVQVVEKYLDRQCQAELNRSGFITSFRDTLKFVFVDTTYSRDLQFYCITDTSKQIFFYNEISLFEDDMANFNHLKIVNRNILATQKSFVTVKLDTLSNLVMKKFGIDHDLCVLGLNDHFQIDNLEIYPVPASDYLNIKSQPSEIILTGALGVSTTIPNTTGFYVGALPKGIYTLVYLEDGVSKRHKIVLQ